MSPPTANSFLFTIGHSSRELSEFLKQLVAHGVQIVGDVRSRPGSYRFPQFNREILEACPRAA
jgi:uncharacterized protein (DUF488 family)